MLTRKTGIWMIAVGETLGYAAMYYLFAALLLNWETVMGWEKSALTMGLFAAIIVSAVLAPLAGRLIDAGRGRIMMSLGLIGGAVGLFLLSRVQTTRTFVLVWAYIGVCHAASLYDPCFAFVTKATGPAAKAYITRITLVAGFASTITFPAATFLAGLFGWRFTVLVFAAGLGGVGAPLMFVGTGLLRRGSSEQSRSSWRADEQNTSGPNKGTGSDVRGQTESPMEFLQRIFKKYQFWLLFFSFPLITVAQGIIITHIVPILVERGISRAIAVTAAATFGPMQVLGRFLLFRSKNNHRTSGLVVLAFSGMSAAIILLLFSGSIISLAFLFSGLFASCYGIISILKPILTFEIMGPRAFGTVVGFLAVPSLLGLAYAPHLGSLLWERGGYSLSLTVGSCSALAGLGCIFILHVQSLKSKKLAASSS